MSDRSAPAKAATATTHRRPQAEAAPPAALFVAGTLPPMPATPREALLRLRRAWRPPDSHLRLADREV